MERPENGTTGHVLIEERASTATVRGVGLERERYLELLRLAQRQFAADVQTRAGRTVIVVARSSVEPLAAWLRDAGYTVKLERSDAAPRVGS